MKEFLRDNTVLRFEDNHREDTLKIEQEQVKLTELETHKKRTNKLEAKQFWLVAQEWFEHKVSN